VAKEILDEAIAQPDQQDDRQPALQPGMVGLGFEALHECNACNKKQNQDHRHLDASAWIE